MIEFKKTAAEMLEYYKIEVFGKMGIDLGNLGGLAESVLKTIGLAGNAI